MFLAPTGPQIDRAVLNVEQPRVGVELGVLDCQQALREVEHSVERALS